MVGEGLPALCSQRRIAEVDDNNQSFLENTRHNILMIYRMMKALVSVPFLFETLVHHRVSFKVTSLEIKQADPPIKCSSLGLKPQNLKTFHYTPNIVQKHT